MTEILVVVVLFLAAVFVAVRILNQRRAGSDEGRAGLREAVEEFGTC